VSLSSNRNPAIREVSRWWWGNGVEPVGAVLDQDRAAGQLVEGGGDPA
jgi:hypothetical protein